MAKSNEELRDEIAKLNAEIKGLKERTKLENRLAAARRSSGRLSITRAKASQERRKARFGRIKNRLIARGIPFSQAVKRARKEVNKRL